MSRHSQILNKKQAALLVVDVQEKINAVMFSGELVKSSVLKLIAGCKVLDVPIFVTEQYPQGLGATEPEIVAALVNEKPLEKMNFSCCGAEGFTAGLKQKEVRQIILTGIECHVCVLQTALDLLAHGFQVHLVKDAVSSRKKLDYETAIQRMAAAGVILTTTETALFELLETAGTSEFKKVAKLIK